MNIDYTAIIGMIIMGVLSIGAVAAFLKSNMPKVEPWVALSKDAVETLADLAKALEPDPTTGKVELTPTEIAQLNADAAAFKVQLNTALGK